MSSSIWQLARSQHGVVTRGQLLELGFNPDWIQHRRERGRLHSVEWGVYAVGRPQLTLHGRVLAAVLSCGPNAAASHDTAGVLYEILPPRGGQLHISIPFGAYRRRPGIVVHRRSSLGAEEVTHHHNIPVTTPICTLIDLATRLDHDQLERAINEADKRDLIRADELRSVLDELKPRPGVAVLRQVLDRRTFTLTDSELERRFIPLAIDAGLPMPQTGCHLNGFKVDFYWPDLKLVVETDGLRYHRTPGQQARDRLRDQTHLAAGLTPLRFTRAQVRYDPAHVQTTLAAVARRLRGYA